MTLPGQHYLDDRRQPRSYIQELPDDTDEASFQMPSWGDTSFGDTTSQANGYARQTAEPGEIDNDANSAGTSNYPPYPNDPSSKPSLFDRIFPR
jgi:hypothetical protein